MFRFPDASNYLGGLVQVNNVRQTSQRDVTTPGNFSSYSHKILDWTNGQERFCQSCNTGWPLPLLVSRCTWNGGKSKPLVSVREGKSGEGGLLRRNRIGWMFLETSSGIAFKRGHCTASSISYFSHISHSLSQSYALHAAFYTHIF